MSTNLRYRLRIELFSRRASAILTKPCFKEKQKKSLKTFQGHKHIVIIFRFVLKCVFVNAYTYTVFNCIVAEL